MLVALAAAACSSGGGGRGGGGGGGGGGSGGPDGPDGAVVFNVTEVRVESMAAEPGPFPEDVWAGVYNTMNAYIDRAVVTPLRSGQPPPMEMLAPLFTPAALERATGVDRAALVEEGTTLSGAVRGDRVDTAFVLLTDREGRPVVVNASVDVVLSVDAADGGVALARTGQVVMTFDEQGWRIDSYDIRTARDSV